MGSSAHLGAPCEAGLARDFATSQNHRSYALYSVTVPLSTPASGGLAL